MKKRTSLLTLLVSVLLVGATTQANIVTDGLIQDLDADLGITLNTDAAPYVSDWVNQIAGAGDDMTVTNGEPQLIADAINSHDAIEFTNDRLNGDDLDAFDTLTQGTGYTWFIVTKTLGNNGGGANGKNSLMGSLSIGDGWRGITAGINGNETPYGLNRPTSSDQRLTAATAINDDSWHILAFRLAAGETGSEVSEIFVDSSTADAAGTVGNISPAANHGALAIGAEREGGSEYVDAQIARILIYEDALTDEELIQTGLALSETYDLPFETPFVWIGDINEDDYVNDADLNLLLSDFDETGPGGGEVSYNQTDLDTLLLNFGTEPEGATHAVPEPSSLALLLLGAFGLLGVVRKKK